MIISASRRTDIPALYGDWFINRVRAGFAVVRNPADGRPVRVPLTPGPSTSSRSGPKIHARF